MNGRRLTMSKKDGYGTSEVVAMSSSVALGFVSTFSSAEHVTSLAALEKVLIVIFIFGCLWGLGLSFMFSVSWYRAWTNQSSELAHAQKIAKRAEQKRMCETAEGTRKSLMNYVDELFPAVFSGSSMSLRLWTETIKHHRYISLFSAATTSNGVNKSFVTTFHLLCIQTMLMFILALCYDLQGPSDDGTCPGFDTEQTCLARKSMFDTTATCCVWDEQLSCRFNDIPFTWTVSFYFAWNYVILLNIIVFVFIAL